MREQWDTLERESIFGLEKGTISTNKAIWKLMIEIWARASFPTVFNLWPVYRTCHKPSLTYNLVQVIAGFYFFSLEATEWVKQYGNGNVTFRPDTVLGCFCSSEVGASLERFQQADRPMRTLPGQAERPFKA